MQSTVESVEGNKVKLHVTVPADEFERAIDAAFRKLAREVRIPGSGPGKAPRRLLEARLGTDIAREQALRDSLPEFYVDAVTEHDVDVDRAARDRDDRGRGRRRRRVRSGRRGPTRRCSWSDTTSSASSCRSRPSTTTRSTSRSTALRDRFADLADSDRPLIDDAYATIDITGSIGGEPVEGLTATDFLYRVGSDMVVPELDQQLHGTRPGAILEFNATLPERFGDRAGRRGRASACS